LSVEIENIRKDIRMRAETDSIMSTAWILIYLIPIFAVILGVLSFLLMITTLVTTFTQLSPPVGPETTQQMATPIMASIIAFYILMLISFLVFIVLIYKLVKRRNTHFKRQIFLFEDILAAAQSIASKKGIDAEVTLASCTRTLREIKADEIEKGAVLWAFLSAIPWIGALARWYVYYFLMKDFYKHERREDGFWEDISKILDKCGIAFSIPRRMETIPNRSFVLYLILTIITFDLFGIYWLYVLLNDPNQHFKYHMQIEDQLLSTLESVAI